MDVKSHSKSTIKTNLRSASKQTTDKSLTKIYENNTRDKIKQLKLSMDRISKLIQVENIEIDRKSDSENEFNISTSNKSIIGIYFNKR